jgi:hypothetical protein
MLFAHLKRILRLGRLQLRGPRGAQFEFIFAAIAQNLRRLAKLVVAGKDCADDGRWLWHCRNHARHRQGQDGDLALAGTVPGKGAAGLWREKTRPSRIPPLSPEVAERVVAMTLASAASRQPLDGRGNGEGGWDQRQFGTTNLARSWPATASGTPL